MDKMTEVFWAIKQSPDRYLPEKSIWALSNFLAAYSGRLRMEGWKSGVAVAFKSFEHWLCNHFGLQRQSQSVYRIVESYSKGPVDAFDKLYSLFEEFLEWRDVEESELESQQPYNAYPKQDACEILRKIRQRPALYVGFPHLVGIHTYLTGHEWAGQDLGLERTADEKLIADFKQWIEKDKFPDGKPRPWFRLIIFYSANDGASACTSFFKLLDEFASKVNRPGIFDAIQ